MDDWERNFWWPQPKWGEGRLLWVYPEDPISFLPWKPRMVCLQLWQNEGKRKYQEQTTELPRTRPLCKRRTLEALSSYKEELYPGFSPPLVITVEVCICRETQAHMSTEIYVRACVFLRRCLPCLLRQSTSGLGRSNIYLPLPPQPWHYKHIPCLKVFLFFCFFLVNVGSGYWTVIFVLSRHILYWLSYVPVLSQNIIPLQGQQTLNKN